MWIRKEGPFLLTPELVGKDRGLKKVLEEVRKRENIRAQDGGTIVFVGGYIISQVEEYRPKARGGEQTGWILHPLDTPSAVVIDDLPKHAVLFNKIDNNVTPEPGDIFVYKRAGESLGPIVSARIIKD